MSEEIEIIAHAYDWQIIDGQIIDEETEIRAWSLMQDSTSCLVRIMNFPVFAHLELPAQVQGQVMYWSDFHAQKVFNYIQRICDDQGPYMFLFKQATKLYYLQEHKTYFLLLVFKNLKAMHNCRKRLYGFSNITGVGQRIKLNLFETNINQVRKFLTQKNCGFAEWYSVKGRLVSEDERVSTCKHEYIVNHKTWERRVDITSITRPGILSIDAETYSHNHRAFPDPHNNKDRGYMLSCVYQRFGLPDTLRKILIIYGVSDPPSEGDEYIFVDSEPALYFKFAEVLQDLDPEVVIGYNIFGFDYRYMDIRLKREGLEWPVLGRIRHEKGFLDVKKWASGAYGQNFLNILRMSGRISIDLLPMVKREHKLPLYNLDYVAKHFLGLGKHNVSAKSMFKIYRQMIMLEGIIEDMEEELRGPYKLTNSEDILVEYEDNIPEDMGPYKRVEQHESGTTIYKLGQTKEILKYFQKQLKQFSEEEQEELRSMTIEMMSNMKVVGEYCLRDSEAVIQLFETLNVWIALVQTSTIAGVTLMDLFTRGQQVRGVSLVYNDAARKGYVLDTRSYENMKWSGGFVYKPIPGLYQGVICLDFKSLYPNIIIALNICWTTLIPKWMESRIPPEKYQVIEWNEPLDEDRWIDDDEEFAYDDEPTLATILEESNDGGKKHRFKHYSFKFIRKEVKEGILPRLVSELIDQRNAVRAARKMMKDPVQKEVAQQRQLSLKVTANSMFGMLGAGQMGVLPLLEGAMSITAFGREQINFSNDYLAAKYNANVVYNDSVTGDTPILVRHFSRGHYGGPIWQRISELVLLKEQSKSQFISTGQKHRKTFCDDHHYQVWSDQGWTKIKKWICHWSNKKIFRVTTNTGMVKVTEDHSLLDENGNDVTPKQLSVGSKLLHKDLPRGSSGWNQYRENLISIKSCYFDVAKMYQDAITDGHNVIIEHNDSYGWCLNIGSDAVPDNKIIDISIVSDGSEGQFVYDLETENHHFSAGIGRLVVHNTDSTMIQIPDVVAGPTLIKWGHRLEKELSDYFASRGWPSLYLEFEKAGPMFSLGKKMYAFWISKMKDGSLPYDEDGRPKYMPRGIPLARRDKPKWQTDIVRTAIDMIFEGKTWREFLDMLIEEIVNGFRGKIFWRNFVVIKGLGSHYKNENYFMKVFSDELHKMGKPVRAGERLEFLIVNPRQSQINEVTSRLVNKTKVNSDKKKYTYTDEQGQLITPTHYTIQEYDKIRLGHKMRLPETYQDRLKSDNPEEIDYLYYVEHFLMNSLELYWKVGYQDFVSRLDFKNEQESYRHCLDWLDNQGFQDWTRVALAANSNDPKSALMALFETPLKNKARQARTKFITGRNIFDNRISSKPIKTLVVGYKKGKLKEAVQGLASVELYQKLYG